MSQVESLRIYFVLPTDETSEHELPSDMKLGFQAVCKYGGYAEWMRPSDCIEHASQDKDVFVFNKFEGHCFETLCQNSSKRVILGARCLLTCITNGRSLPPNPYPIFSEGMRDLYVTSSGFDQATKRRIQERVQYMSGHYDNSLRGITTHVVAHNNLSSKAIHAYKGNVKIMMLSWVEDVWQQNIGGHVHGSDEVFNKHISPLFHNLSITTSGLPKKEKETLKEIIENHGGRFMGTLEEGVTNVVLLTKPIGEKYKFAKAWGIACVRPEWIHQCVDAKAILPFNSYVVEATKPKASTPNKDNFAVNFSADFTANLSVINNVESQKCVNAVDETAATASVRNAFQTPRVNVEQSKVQNSKSSHLSVINNFLLKNLKDAGLFLDGLNIFLHGFHPEEKEKLKRVLNKGGATRFNELSEAVTHIVAGQKDEPNLERLAKFGAYVLSFDWLVESMKLKHKANEAKFLLVNATNPAEPPSPMSKVGAKLLSQTEGKILHLDLDDEKENEKFPQIDEILCRYNASQLGEPLDQPGLNTPANTDPATSSTNSNCSSDDFFSGVTFYLSSDLSENEARYLEDLIVDRKGKVVGKRHLGVPDYAIVPMIGACLTEVTAMEVVTDYFIKDCCLENRLLAPKYYHQPVAFVKDAKPLKNCVISVSNYVQNERDFVEMLIEALGGVAQAILARKPKNENLKSTHLICTEAQGQKYEGAIRWGLPVVHHDWLLKCAALGIRVSEKPYLIGDSKVEVTMACTPKSPAPEVDKIPPPLEGRVSPDAVVPVRATTTPVHNVIARLKLTETPKNGSPDPNRTVTPTSPYGAFYGNGSPTPQTRKRIWKWMNQGSGLPVDPPSKSVEKEEESTPFSQLISRHLDMLKRKPEELPSDSPVGLPSKRLNMEDEEENEINMDPDVLFKKMRDIEKSLTATMKRSPPVIPPRYVPEGPMRVVTESQPQTEVVWGDPLEPVITII